MVATVRAVYEEGRFRPLEPVDLAEGQQVELMFSPSNEKNALRAALSHLIIQWPDPNDDTDAGIEQRADQIARALQDAPSLSDMVIEERGEL